MPADNAVLPAPPSLREVLRARGSKAEAKTPPVASTTSFQVAPPTGPGGQPSWRPLAQQQNIPSMVTNRAFPTPYAVNQTGVSTPQSQFGPPRGAYPMQTPYQHQSSAPLPVYPPPPQQQQQQQPTATFAYQQQHPVQSYPLPPSMVPQRPGQQYSVPMYQQISSMPPSQTLLSMRASQHSSSTVQPVMSQQYRPVPPVQSPPSTQLGQQQIANPAFGGQPGAATMPNLQQYGNATPSFQPTLQPSQNQSTGFPPANARTPPPPHQYRAVAPTLQPTQQHGSNSSLVAPNLQQHGTSTSSQVLGSSLPGQQLVQNPPSGVHIGSGPYQYGTPTTSHQSVYSPQTSSLVRTTVENPLNQGPQASRQTLDQFTKQPGNFPWPPQQYYGSQQYPVAYTYSNLTPYNHGFYNPSQNTPPVPSNNSPSLLQAQHQLQPQNQMPLAPQPQGGSVVASVAPPPNPAISQSGSALPSTKSDAEKPPPNEMDQPTTVGHTPSPVASLGATNVPGVDDVVGEAPENFGRTPISPHILTQADLEVQKHEKQLRATYDATVLSLIDSSIVKNNGTTTATSTPHSDPLSDPLALNRFIDATERLLTWLETMNDPPQGGNSLPPSSSRPLTRLDQSWSRVNEIITKRSGKRPTQAAALCAAAKNRRQECIAYDFNRVSLKREPLSKKDDYINASHLNFVSSLGDWCPRYILTQAPLITTVTDFWSMIFDQACELVVLALPPRRRTSLLPSNLDPPESYAEGAYGDPEDSLRVPPHLPPLKVGSKFNVGSGNSALEIRLQAVKFTHVDAISQQSPSADSIAQSTCIERILTLRNCCTQQTRTIVHLCYSGLMPTSSDPNSIASFTGFVQTAIGFYKQQRSLMHPIAVVSEDGGGLGGIFLSTSVAVLHAEVLGRVADVCELVGCLCQQRRGVYSQADQLAATCGVVGLAAKQFLARRDIVVGPSLSSVRKSTSLSDDAKALENPKQPEGAPQTRAQDFASSLFSDQPLQLSDMMSALGFSPTLSPPQSKESSKSLPVDGVSSQPLNAGSAGAGGSGTNALFDDLSPHLANISLTESGASVSPANRRHYQARDFVDKAYKESRDNLAVDPNVFGDLESFCSQSQSSANKNN